jgi:hypothetical protein
MCSYGIGRDRAKVARSSPARGRSAPVFVLPGFDGVAVPQVDLRVTKDLA